ncbi:MAG: BamA/TamA family outer membrane protein [Bacteroidia bacterium]|nr:BamA/TamA family outer membrane protein [Bacteroidia bacterium]
MRLRAILIFKSLSVFSVCLAATASAQSIDDKVIKTSVFSLEIQSADEPSLLKKINYKKTFLTESERDKELKNVLFACFDKAYLTASYDSLIVDSLHLKAYLNLGLPYKWALLKNGNVDEGVLSEIGYREKLYNDQPIYYKGVKRLQEKIITYYENNGYPFASVMLDSIVISEGTIKAQLKLSKNSEEKIDSIIIRGTAKISPVYLYNYLGIKPGNLYNESKLKKVNARIAEIPFIRSSKPANILFTNKFNKLILNLEKKQASQFNGIIGILPDNNTGKIMFTGDVSLKLQNGLGRGELIDLNWRRLQTQTQDLKLRLVYPFVLRSPFGVDYNFKLYKKDTTFLDINQNIGLQYIFTGGNYFKIFYNNKTSTLLSTKGLEYSTTLPPNADIQNNMYGIGLKYEKLDYRLNPRKGFSFLGNASAGTKNIKINHKLNPVVYEKLKLNSTQYNADMEASVFIPVMDRTTIKAGVQAAFLYGETIFQNELFRIGGLKTLRGFDEESIYASAFSIFTLEYRYILEQNSYLYVFGDAAYYEKNSIGNIVHDSPIGFGAGISFETKAGIFSINYALGKQFDNPIQLRSGKIHFGIVNYF